MSKYIKEFQVHYYEINRFKEATPTTILNYLQETAITHSESLGYGLDKLKEDNLGWVLSRWHIEMDKFPFWGDKIIIETWTSGFNRFYATREFYLKDEKENIIGRATTLWVFLDIVRKRPKRVPVEIGEVYGCNPKRALDKEFTNLTSIENSDREIDFYVRQSDIDTNNHVNNIKYVEWILESIPVEVLENYRLYSLEVEYKKETRYGETVIAKSINVEGKDLLELNHSIVNKDTENDLTLGKTIWVKR